MNQEGTQGRIRGQNEVSVTTKEEALLGARLGLALVAPDHGSHHSSVGRDWQLTSANSAEL